MTFSPAAGSDGAGAEPPPAEKWLGLRWRRRQSDRLWGGVTDLANLAEKLGHSHAREGFEERRNLRSDFGNVAGKFVGAGSVDVAGGDDGDLVDFAEWLTEGANHFRESADEFVEDGSLVVLLEGFGLDVHGAGFRITLLEDDFGFGFTLRANGSGLAFGFGHQAVAFGVGEGLNARALDFGRLEERGNEFAFAVIDFGVLNFDLGFALDLLNANLLQDDGLLLAIGFDFVSLVGLRLGSFADFQIVGFFDVEVALRFGLLGERSGFGGDAFLVGLRLGDGGGAGSFGALDGDVAIGFGGGYFGIAFDASDVRASHVGDVFVFVADFLDGEADDFEPHLAHVSGASGTHAIANHFGLLDDLFDGELANDSAEVAFHHKADEAFALLRGLGKELFGSGENGLFVILHLDLRDGLDSDRDALIGVEIMLWSDVEGHQFQRQIPYRLHNRKNS